MPGNELIGEEEKNAIIEIFSKSNGVFFAHGYDKRRNSIYRVRNFEREISNKFNVNFTQLVSSGTIAQVVAMLSLGIKPGDEVITQSHTFVATVEAILSIGAIPVIADIDETFNICPIDLENKISKKTKLIIPVHMLGNPCEMNDIIRISKKYKIPILEDACEAFGANYQGKPLGTIGDIGVFSLDFGKTITCGEGGIICTDKKTLYEFCRDYHDHGHQNNPNFSRADDTRVMYGLNYRITEFQAAIGIEQLKKLDFILKSNKKNKKNLKENINSSNLKFRTITDKEGELSDTLIFYFENKKLTGKFLKSFFSKGYNTKNIPDALRWHFSGYWEHMFDKNSKYFSYDRNWIKSKNLLERSVSIPINNLYKENQLEYMIDDINKILKTI